MNSIPDRVIVCAAIKLSSGRIICGVRHFDKLMRMNLPDDFIMAKEAIAGHEQGFVDNKYQFLSREEAWEVASNASQIIVSEATIFGTLFSEDLY